MNFHNWSTASQHNLPMLHRMIHIHDEISQEHQNQHFTIQLQSQSYFIGDGYSYSICTSLIPITRHQTQKSKNREKGTTLKNIGDQK